jgi:hypothetical protein
MTIEDPGILLTKEMAIEYVIFLGWYELVPDISETAQKTGE